MRKMRKLTTILLIMAMVLSLGGCGSKEETTKDATDAGNSDTGEGQETTTDQAICT